ncbi:MAG: hypothetical protein ABI408_11445 [Gemmatimonadaceae bacterium]
MDPHTFLQNLAVVLCVAAVATVVFQRLRQPVVFGYLLAGMIIGPHISIPLVGGGALFARFSRQDEAEADQEGFNNVVRAGISPEGIDRRRIR